MGLLLRLNAAIMKAALALVILGVVGGDGRSGGSRGDVS